MYNIIQKKKIWYLISSILLLPGIVALFMGGLHLGIDFTGGSITRYTFPEDKPSAEKIREVVSMAVSVDLQVQEIGDSDMIIRSPLLSNEEKNSMRDIIFEAYGDIEEVSFESIGPTIGKELRSKAITAIILVLVFIILYITFAFRKIGMGPVQSWVYGGVAVITLAHDILFVTGVFALLGIFFQVEIGSLFVTALLTTLGFSIHDTIVVFDRIRERLRVNPASTFEQTVNESVNQTILRSINTSITTILVLISLYIFGGESIKDFVLALIIGIFIGTYSSIFIASPLLVTWERFKSRNLR